MRNWFILLLALLILSGSGAGWFEGCLIRAQKLPQMLESIKQARQR